MQEQSSPNTSMPQWEALLTVFTVQHNFNEMKDSSGSSQQPLSTNCVPGTVG